MFSIDQESSTVTLSRTVCCESYRQYRKRCELCPSRCADDQECAQKPPAFFPLRRAYLKDSALTE